MITTLLLGAAVAVGQTRDPQTGNRPAAKSIVAGTPTPEVRIDSGAIRGLVVGDKKDVHAYKGIPYAAPPVGERRWKPPQPVLAWSGVRDCFEFGAACPQTLPALLVAIPDMAIKA